METAFNRLILTWFSWPLSNTDRLSLKVHLKGIQRPHEAIKYLYSDLKKYSDLVFYINQITKAPKGHGDFQKKP